MLINWESYFIAVKINYNLYQPGHVMNHVSLSICIPCYEMGGVGDKYLEHNLKQLLRQNFKNFEVIIADQSQNDKIKLLCKKYQNDLNIKYFLNSDGKKQCAANTNYAMHKASGDVIKIILQDDYLYSDHALLNVFNTFKNKKITWCVSGCEHSNDGLSVFRPFVPIYNKNIQFGNNTISSPSVLALRRENLIEFDEALIYLTDVDLYKRYYDRDGLPFVIDDILVVNRLHKNQVSQNVSKSLIRSELHYVRKKFKSDMNLKNWFVYLRRVVKTFM